MTNPVHGANIVPQTVVIIDTDAYSHLYVKQSSAQAADLKRRLVGRLVFIATQTRAELKAWPLSGKWGALRTARLEQLLAKTVTVPVNEDIVDAYARLTADCRDLGHALGQKDHAADRWVAATAIALDRPLMALDRIYENLPGLRRI